MVFRIYLLKSFLLYHAMYQLHNAFLKNKNLLHFTDHAKKRRRIVFKWYVHTSLDKFDLPIPFRLEYFQHSVRLYVTWNLFTVGSLQFPNDSTIASLEANQNRPKTLTCSFTHLLHSKDELDRNTPQHFGKCSLCRNCSNKMLIKNSLKMELI